MSNKYAKDKTLLSIKTKKDEHISGIAGAIFAVFLIASTLGAIIMSDNGVGDTVIGIYVTTTMFIGIYILFALKVASQWEKVIVLRLGRFKELAGPGPFWIIPIVDTVPTWIDHRVMVTPFSAEKTLTKDTVPVDVDAVLFWVVWDAEKAALEVEDYRVAITWAAQTALREVIGQMDLANILIGRAKMDDELQKIIDERTTPLGGDRAVRRNPRRGYSTRFGRYHVTSGAGRARTTSACHSGRI